VNGRLARLATAVAEEAIEDKDKSSHRSIGGSSKDEGSDSVSDNDSGGGFDEISVTVRRRLLRDGGAVARKC